MKPPERRGRRRAWLSAWLPVLLYGLALFVQSSLPALLPTPGDLPLDKLAHFGAYAVLGALCMRALAARPVAPRLARAALMSVLWCGLYGISDEIHQMFVPGRSAEVLDAAADLLGAVAGVLLYWKALSVCAAIRERRG